MALMHMEKRAQVSVFMVVAVLILVLGGLLIYSGQLGPKKSKEVVSEQAALSSAASSVNAFVNACLKQEADKAIGKHGFVVPFSEIGIRDDVELGVVECSGGFESFKQQGITVSSGVPRVSVSIQPTVVAVSLSYPLTVTGGGKRSTVNEFSYTYDRDKSLKLDGSGQVSKTTVLASHDKKAELLFPQGITISDYSGTPVNSYSIEELDREEIAFPENVVSARVYELTPGEFSGPIRVTLAYPDDYENPEELYVAWYDEEKAIWHGIPTDRDTARKTLSADLEHATKVGAVKCASGSGEVKVIGLRALVFEQRCGKSTGRVAPGGSEVFGTCIDSISPKNFWHQDEKGRYILTGNPKVDGTISRANYPIIAAVQPNEEYPKSQLSSNCVIKSWDGKDKENDIQSRCQADVPAVELGDLEGDAAADPNARCVELCDKDIRKEYGPLYGNLKLSGGDGLVDGSTCTCTRAGTDLECGKKEIAAPPTPGYESGISGGYGALEFYIKPGGCVVDKDGKGTPHITVYASDQDPIKPVNHVKGYEVRTNLLKEPGRAIEAKYQVINPVEEEKLKQDFTKFYKEAVQDNIGLVIGLVPEGSDLKAGWNKIYFKVDEIKSGPAVSGCAHLWVNAQIVGTGISETDVEGKSWKDCSVQQRINYMSNARLTAEGQKELAALLQAKGGEERDETEQGNTKLTDISGYEENYLGKDTGTLRGCGGDTSKTEQQLELERACKELGSGGYCYDENNGEEQEILFGCAYGVLKYGAYDCSKEQPGTVCSKGTKYLNVNGLPVYESVGCSKPESSGCFYKEINDKGFACVEEGKPEIYFCQGGPGGVRKESSCGEGNCYARTYGGPRGGVCGESVCSRGGIAYYCEGKRWYACDGKSIATDGNGNEMSGECGEDEKCVSGLPGMGLANMNGVCVSSKPSCKGKPKDTQSGDVAWYCVDKEFSPKMYNCLSDKPSEPQNCPDAGVCVKDMASSKEVCSKTSTALEAFCKDKVRAGYPMEGYYCELPDYSSTLIKCDAAGKYVQVMENYCDKFGSPCRASGVSNPDEACKPVQTGLGEYTCVEKGKPELIYKTLRGEKKKAECQEGHVCEATAIMGKKPGDICMAKYDYYCTSKGLNKPANKAFCKTNNRPDYYTCVSTISTTKSLSESSCLDGYVCVDGASTVTEASCKPAPGGCSREGGFCLSDRQTAAFYSCTLNKKKGVLEREEGKCNSICCGGGGQVKCDAECSSCYGGETSAIRPDDKGKWYSKGEEVCSDESVTDQYLLKCSGGRDGWVVSKYCGEDENCMGGKGCVKS